MMRFAFLGVASVGAVSVTPDDQILSLWNPADFSAEEQNKIEAAFLAIHEQLAAEFPTEAFENSFLQLKDALVATSGHKAYRATAGQQCQGMGFAPPGVAGMAAFPGGAVRSTSGFNMAKMIFNAAQSAAGSPAAASSSIMGPLAMLALQQGAGTIQGMVSTALATIPPMVPPPAWDNQPLNCMPMPPVGFCAGMIPHMITPADAVMTDVSARAVEGAVAAFPALYARTVGKTSDSQYKACFSAYASMKCANLFPKCSVARAFQHPGPMGKLGMCFTHCVATLVACPGMWINDIQEECRNGVSAPPACSFALPANPASAPPQYMDFEDAGDEEAMECPTDNGFGAGSAGVIGGGASAGRLSPVGIN